MAGLIVISCFTVFGVSYAPVQFKWNSPSKTGYSANIDVTFQYYVNGQYLTLHCTYFTHYYYYQSGSLGSDWSYTDYYYVTANNTNNMVRFIYGKNQYYGVWFTYNGTAYNVPFETITGTYNKQCINLTSTRPIKAANGYDVAIFNNEALGYTLTFDSKGGSAITTESGVTDVILGDSTGYFPQYIPTRLGYTFLGWSLTPGGTYVREVELTEDTTIYANWSTEYKQLKWSEIGNTAGYISFQSSWLLDGDGYNAIVNFDTCYYNLYDNELMFTNGLFDDQTYDSEVLLFDYTPNSATGKYAIYYFSDFQTADDFWIYTNNLPWVTNEIMGICDFERLYNVTGWKLADFAQPDGTTTINYVTQNIDLYTNVSLSSSAPEYAYNNRTITYYYTGTKLHWYNEFNVTYYRAAGAPGFTETIKATKIENTNKYMFSINTQEFNEITISLKLYQTYTCALTISQYPGYVINIYNGTEHLTESSTFEYDSYKGIELRFDLEYPYVNVDVFLMELVAPPLQPEVTYDYVINSTVLKPDATEGEGMMRFYVTADPYADCELIINPRYITDYTVVQRNPIVSINSEGEMSWIIDTENAWNETMSNIDYAQITANIPQVFNGILDGIYGLSGLSMIVTLLFVIGFTSWIIRNY